MGERLAGIAASPGIVAGRAFLVDRRRLKTPKRHISGEEVAIELGRFEEALKASHEQLERVKRKLREHKGEEPFAILEAHQLILRDEHLVEPTQRRIREERINVEWALRKTVEEIRTLFNAVEEDYFRERRSDVDFVGERVLRNLLGEQADLITVPPAGAVIVAHELSPADTAQLHRAACAGFVTDVGGKTSHAAILARAFRIPAVVGVEHASERIAAGDLIIVDGQRGEVWLQPTEEQLAECRERGSRWLQQAVDLARNHDLPAQTTDGVRVHLLANVELVEELPAVLDQGAEGIGLYRTEILYLDRADLPREEEHLMHARGVLRRMAPFPVTFRTLDLGGDKIGPGGMVGETNPALGLRSIRLCLRDRPMFKSQLRGLLRASGSGQGRMRLLLPMISGVEELREAYAVLDEARDELRREGAAFQEEVPVGVMVEMPAAALLAEELGRACDFLSIGTNDLIQYTLAVDRVNEHVSYLFRPLHPAILRLISLAIEGGHRAGVRVGLCGEMAGEPLYAMVLLGLGVDELSMNPTSVPLMKTVIRGFALDEARQLAEEVLRLDTSQAVEERVRAAMAARFPDDLLRTAGDAW